MSLSVLGSIGWMLLALARLEAFRRGGDPLFLVAALHAGLAAWRLVFRAEASREAPWPQRLAAWAGAALPLLLRDGRGAVPLWAWAMALAGALLSLWALWSLGEAFGVAPARRGRIATAGPYRLVRHPAYLGEAMSITAFAAAWPSLWNAAAAGAAVGLLTLRIRWEEALLSEDPDYRAYMERTRWRMLPLLF